MKTQIVYQSNLDYEVSYQNLVESNIAITDKTAKGIIWLRFKDTKTIFMISPYGKIEVAWKNPEEKKVLLKILKNTLVPKEGQKLKLKPVKQIREFSYPAPRDFKLFWCDEETEYVRKPVRVKEPRIVTFITTAIISIFGFVIIQGLSNTALQGANQTMPEILKIFVKIYPYIPLAFAVIGVTGFLLEAKRLLQGKIKLSRIFDIRWRE